MSFTILNAWNLYYVRVSALIAAGVSNPSITPNYETLKHLSYQSLSVLRQSFLSSRYKFILK